MEQIIFISLFLAGMGTAFWLGRILTKSQVAQAELELSLMLKKKLGEAEYKIKQMETNFDAFKERVRNAKPSELNDLLQQALRSADNTNPG